MKNLIYHVDVNSAFLSWEAAYRIFHLSGKLDIRTIPSAVGGSQADRHGIILAKSVLAKKFGIQTGMTLIEAKRKCPDIYLVPPNYGLYQKCSRAFLNILREYTPDVEVYSIDEAFMDMSNVLHLYDCSPLELGNKIKKRIEDELGFTVNIGISTNKLLAKMAGELKKPNLVHTLYRHEIPDKLWPLPVSELFFVGRATTKKLLNIGIHTIGELAQADPVMLKAILKKHGEVVWGFANGIDASSVTTAAPPQKGYGNSTTTSFDVKDASHARLVLLGLSETVGARLRKDDARAEVVSIGIKSYDLSYMSHQMVMPSPTNINFEIYRYSCQLFDQLWDGITPIRHLGIHTSRISYGSDLRQLNFFDTIDYVQQEKLDKTIDSIRLKYGLDAVKRASFIESPIDHMEGGVSRAKRTVDYEKFQVD